MEKRQNNRRAGLKTCQGLALEVFDLAGGCRSHSVAGQTPLAGFEELFRPVVVEALGDPFPAAEFGVGAVPLQKVSP